MATRPSILLMGRSQAPTAGTLVTLTLGPLLAVHGVSLTGEQENHNLAIVIN